MRVLMFGWGFPPHQAGGLATAMAGLVQGLLADGVATVSRRAARAGEFDVSVEVR